MVASVLGPSFPANVWRLCDVSEEGSSSDEVAVFSITVVISHYNKLSYTISSDTKGPP